MPPIYVKGGVWSNIEDEILKAAVSKYGTNQWSRVASLLPKKSAKQVKARWNEWLNPKVNHNKVWTIEQDEKLLSLSKLLPNQWRTIASVIGDGRTATNCVERYQKLIDDVDTEFKLVGPGIESMPGSGQQAASVVGDININPETKPSRPDDEDISDEEREMLAEAKARLANTSGKKAKRKLRERMLEESKRIALLQKRRELKAAGFNVSLTKKRKKNRLEFDYNSDIPHEHVVPSGLHDVKQEIQVNEDEKSKFNLKVSKSGIEMEQPKPKQVEKPGKQKVRKEATTSVETEPIKRRKLNLSAPEEETSIQEDRIVGTKPIAKVDRKSISKLLKSTFSTLPPPKVHQSTIIPKFTEEEDIIYLDSTSQDQDEGEKFRNLKLLRELNEEKSKLLQSQVIQRGLEIPNPDSLTLVKGNHLEELINQEFTKLIKSDFRKYKDSSYQAPIVQDLDYDIFEKTNQEIDSELVNMKINTSDQAKYELPRSKTIAKQILAKLQQLKENCSKSIVELESQEYIAKRAKLIQSIQDNYQELISADEELEFAKDRAKEEEIVFKVESNRLESAVDRLTKSTNAIQERVRQLTVEKLTN
ncbi:Pre-mRNA-splicing factor CEF1 [Spathaspora sp. JA1]|nr:Pre-mRNA-splicing factor CEF1 [Spathaspora sp. JA1]